MVNIIVIFPKKYIIICKPKAALPQKDRLVRDENRVFSGSGGNIFCLYQFLDGLETAG